MAQPPLEKIGPYAYAVLYNDTIVDESHLVLWNLAVACNITRCPVGLPASRNINILTEVFVVCI